MKSLRNAIFNNIINKTIHKSETYYENGFTLIELTLVMAVTAIIGGFATLAFTNRDAMNLEAASRMMRRDIRYAQNMAVITGHRYDVNIYVEYDLYAVKDFTKSKADKLQEMPAGVKIIYARPPQQITYYQWGTVDNTSPMTIILESERHKREMTVLPSSGRVELKKTELK